MKTRIFLRTLQRNWWLILMTALIAVIVSMLVSYLTEPVYKVSAKFIVVTSTHLASENGELNDSDVQSRVVVAFTFLEIINSQNVMTKALQSLEPQLEDVDKYNHLANVVPNSSVIELIVTGPNSQTATLLANTIGEQAIIYYNQIDQGFNIALLDKAVPAIIPTRPRPLHDASVALLIGIITGITLAFVRGQLQYPLEAYRMRLSLDSATGVYSIGYFSRLIEGRIAGNADSILTVGIIELQGLLDFFDIIPTQDLNRLLILATDSIRRELRGDDIIGRWDNATFIVMMQDTTEAAAVRIFDKIRTRLVKPVQVDRVDASIQFNPYIGVCEYSGDLTAQEIFESAYAALNQARQGSGLSVWKKDNSIIVEKNIE